MGHPTALALTGPSSARRLDVEALYRTSAGDVYAYVRSLLHDDTAAEEVVAVAFERALRRARSYDPRRGTPRAWLFGIARNAALDELRRGRRRAVLPDEPEAPGEGDLAEETARRATVRAALAGLEPRDREVVALRFHAGLSQAELAQVLGVSETAAATRLHRAVTRLRRACDAG